jgi:prepilin-type N-terminal cleavage/methylation domain-containing protein
VEIRSSHLGQTGFTIVELIIALVVLTIGLLGLVGTSALVTRMVARGQRSAMAALHAAQRLERLRASACRARADGSEPLYRGGTEVGRNEWRWATAGTDLYRLRIETTYTTAHGRQRSELMETTISCVR